MLEFYLHCFTAEFQYPRVSPGDQPLAKEPEDLGTRLDIAPLNCTHVLYQGMATSIVYCSSLSSLTGGSAFHIIAAGCNRYPTAVYCRLSDNAS